MLHALAGIGLGAIIALAVTGITNGIAKEVRESVPDFAYGIIGILCGSIGYLVIVAATGGF